MKMVVAVVQAEDAGGLLAQLSNRGFRATRIKTVGGFLREANATVFIGVEDDEVEDGGAHDPRELHHPPAADHRHSRRDGAG